MKISTRLKIAALAPTMMAVVIGSALLFSYSSVRKTQANSKTVGNIVSNTNELSSLTTEYILYRENRPKQQFLEVHDSIMRLTAIRFRNPEQQQLLDTIVGNSESMKGLFQKLVSNYDLFPPDKSDTRLREAEQRLAGQLILRLRQVGADASRLQMLTHDEITATQTRTNTLIIFVIVISALPLTFVLSRTRKSITSSLTTFRRGTEVVASGNLTHRIGIAARDEIGELSRAFDVMTEQLGYITVSRDELSREVEERKLAEEALLEQREWLRVTLTSIGDAVIATDTFGLVTFLNPVAGELTGWQSEEANGQPIQSVFRIINEQTRKASENVVERVLREGNIVNLANHTALMTRDGREIPIEDSAAPIRDKDGELTGVVLVFHNVTEKRRAQEALLESQQKNEFLADIIRISSQPFVVGYPDGRLGLVNSAFEHLTGYSSDELQSTDWAIDLTPSEWLPLERQKMEEQILTGKPIRYEKEYIRKDGSRVPIELLVHLVKDSDGRPQYYYSFLTDITERKQMEKALRESERLYRAIGESIDYGIWTCDSDGRNTYASESFLKLVGITQKECSDFGWGDVLHPEDIEHTIAAWKECVRTGGIWDIEHRFRGIDGQWHPILARGVPVRNESGEIVCWAGINLDISSFKKMEEELRKSKDDLESRVQERTAELRISNKALMEHALKLERLNQELEEFAFVASHDLQEPLRKIQTFGSMLMQNHDGCLAEHAHEYLARITGSAKRMSDSIHSLLDYSKMTSEPLSFEHVDLGAIAGNIVADMEPLISLASGTIEIQNLPMIEADAGQIRRVLQHLIDHSIKFRREAENPLVKIHGETNSGMCSIFVEDNGIGFEEQYLDLIFRPFQQLHSRGKYEGIGMGLALCRKIVERHDGSITARSTPGKGSTFIVRLPVLQRERLSSGEPFRSMHYSHG